MRLGVRCSPAPLGTVEEFPYIKEGKGNLRVIPLFGSLAQGWEYRLDAYSLLKVGSNPISSAIINYMGLWISWFKSSDCLSENREFESL